MRIGIDIDETIASTFEPAFHYAKAKHGFDAEFDDLTHHDWANVEKLGISKEEERRIFYEFYHKAGNDAVLPIPGSVEGCRRLKAAGHELFAITGRSDHVRKPTEEWIARHFPNLFSEIVFTNHNSETAVLKSEVCRRFGISEMVDDNMDFALDLAESGVRTYVIERPWNRRRTEIHPLLVRVPGWNQITI
jgi:uncharacterized HAD superfamily protein